MIKFAVITALAFLALDASAQRDSSIPNSSKTLSQKIDAYLTSAVSAYAFTGSALVAKNGKVIFHKAYGYKNVAAKTSNDTGTKFPILSITKTFTAVVLQELQQQGQLSLDDPLSKYFPDLQEGDKIKLHHLLTHTSGLVNYTDAIDEADSAIVCHPVTRQQVLDLFYNKPLLFKPGKGFSYNNSAYFLLGMIIEKVSGKSYYQNVRELIFEPLGMNNSGFDFIHLPADAKATGYQFLSDRQQKAYPFPDSTVTYSAGSIYSTTADMYKWTQAIAKGQLLSKVAWQQALAPRGNGYSYGFQVGAFEGKKYVKHSGGYPGYVSEFTYYPDEDVTIILLKNSGNYGQDIWPITMDLSDIVFNLPYDLWRLRTPVKLPEDIMRQKEGLYTLNKRKVAFSVKDNQLYIILPGGDQLPLLAESEDLFYLENYTTQLHFIKDEKGDVEKVMVRERGKDFYWKKIK